jgi:murein DD-endopeptidase MepM/ murein hydrolase activator NlpD
VQPGDTLYGIAAVTGLSVATLLTLNGLDSALIYPGQVLRLEPPHVTVKRGDTLWALAQKQHVSIAALRAANGLGRSAVLHPGDTLVIPPRPATATATDKADIGGAAVRTVTVAKGDTLSSLARRYHTTAATLIAVNGLSGSELRVGQSLRVVPTPPTYAFRRAIPPPVTGLIWPLVGAITSPFGARDFRVAGSSFHTGLDIDGHTGDPVRAAVGGTVIFSGWNAQGYGNLLIVHVGDADYFYAHCSKLLVKKGATVRQGQVIALVGATGDATGSHLHFEIRVNDTPINPLPFLTQHVSAP